jgi:secondary thiamine-phosphate synthase enzyme
MSAHIFKKSVASRGNSHMLEITPEVSQAVTDTGLETGIATVFVTGSTAGITTIEFEPGLELDFNAAFERLFPRDMPYHHHERWGDGNGHSHVRASTLGPSLTVPFQSGKLTLGTWQQIILVDFDTRPRTRNYVVQVLGE